MQKIYFVFFGKKYGWLINSYSELCVKRFQVSETTRYFLFLFQILFLFFSGLSLKVVPIKLYNICPALSGNKRYAL